MTNAVKRILFVASLLLYIPASAQAGTFYTGVKWWQASWDSAMADWFNKELGEIFQANGQDLTTTSEPGDGYLAGPLIGYQTDDGKWSFSFAPMVVSNFSQDWQGTSTATTIYSAVEMERRDFDLTASYAINKYVKGYFGYKYQDMKMDNRLTTETVVFGIPVRDSFHYQVKSRAHIPSLGVAGTWPISEQLVPGLQAGVLYASPNLVFKETEHGLTQDVRPWPGFGYNVEGTLTYRPLAALLLQGGYRYQVFKMVARTPGRNTTTTSRDVTQGWTVSAIYLF